MKRWCEGWTFWDYINAVLCVFGLVAALYVGLFLSGP